MGEGGFSSTETLIVLPVLVLFVDLVFFCGRASLAHQEVYGAARDAARAASVSSGPDAALAAETAAKVTLSTRQAACASPAVRTDMSQFRRGGVVKVVVTCQMAVSDLDLLGAPGNTTVRTSYTESIDPLIASRG